MTIYPKLTPGSVAYSTFDTAKIFNIDPHTFKGLMAAGYISGGLRVQWGKAYKTVFGKDAVRRIGLFLKLKQFVANESAAIIAEGIGPDDFRSILILQDGKADCPVLLPIDRAPALADYGSAVVINLPTVKAWVDSAIADYFKTDAINM